MVGFMVAGYDTTSNALSYAMHILTTHPDELVKLQDEIDAKFSPDSDVTSKSQSSRVTLFRSLADHCVIFRPQSTMTA